MSLWYNVGLHCLSTLCFLDPLSKNERKFGLDGLFLTSAVSWVGVRAKVTGCWNCYKENLAAVLSQPLENNFKLWCEIYWEPLPGNSGRHAHQVNSHFFPQTSALHQWNGTDSNSERAVMCQTPLQKEDYKVLKPKNRPCLCSQKWKKKPKRNIMKAYFYIIFAAACKSKT